MTIFTIQLYGQNLIDIQSSKEQLIICDEESIDGVVTSLKNLNNDNLTYIIGTLEKLSNELSENYQGLNSEDKTLGRTDTKVQNLYYKDIVSILDNVVFSLSKFNDSCSFDGIISNLKELSKQYENSSYDNLKENLKE